jgi:hypothetical protein
MRGLKPPHPSVYNQDSFQIEFFRSL